MQESSGQTSQHGTTHHQLKQLPDTNKDVLTKKWEEEIKSFPFLRAISNGDALEMTDGSRVTSLVIEFTSLLAPNGRFVHRGLQIPKEFEKFTGYRKWKEQLKKEPRRRLETRKQRAGLRVKEEFLYVCGSTLFPGGDMQDKILVKESLHCGSPIETTYYSGKSPIFDNICFNGGDTEITRNRKIWQLGEEYGIDMDMYMDTDTWIDVEDMDDDIDLASSDRYGTSDPSGSESGSDMDENRAGENAAKKKRGRPVGSARRRSESPTEDFGVLMKKPRNGHFCT
uniref:Uncharacterized protein n=1 Tax=Magallana gigas TaxID=29159 RepID=K1R165_MAGGI